MLEINDPSTIHNFHLGGPRAAVDVASDVAGTGEKTAIVLLQEQVVHLHLRRAPDQDDGDLQHSRPDTDAELGRPFTEEDLVPSDFLCGDCEIDERLRLLGAQEDGHDSA